MAYHQDMKLLNIAKNFIFVFRAVSSLHGLEYQGVGLKVKKKKSTLFLLFFALYSLPEDWNVVRVLKWVRFLFSQIDYWNFLKFWLLNININTWMKRLK